MSSVACLAMQYEEITYAYLGMIFFKLFQNFEMKSSSIKIRLYQYYRNRGKDSIKFDLIGPKSTSMHAYVHVHPKTTILSWK